MKNNLLAFILFVLPSASFAEWMSDFSVDPINDNKHYSATSSSADLRLGGDALVAIRCQAMKDDDYLILSIVRGGGEFIDPDKMIFRIDGNDPVEFESPINSNRIPSVFTRLEVESEKSIELVRQMQRGLKLTARVVSETEVMTFETDLNGFTSATKDALVNCGYVGDLEAVRAKRQRYGQYLSLVTSKILNEVSGDDPGRCLVAIELSSLGSVVASRILQCENSSPSFEENVESAIYAAEPLPTAENPDDYEQYIMVDIAR